VDCREPKRENIKLLIKKLYLNWRTSIEVGGKFIGDEFEFVEGFWLSYVEREWVGRWMVMNG
jgi:hypothetical protein